MRKTAIIGAAMALVVAAQPAAFAQSGSSEPSLAQTVPMPDVEPDVNLWRIAAISTGAVVGVVVVNAVTGGLITPVLLSGAGSAPGATGAVAAAQTGGAAVVATTTSYTAMAIQAASTMFGAVAGGYFGNWLYE